MKSLKEVLAIGVLATATVCLVGQSRDASPSVRGKSAQREAKPVAAAVEQTEPSPVVRTLDWRETLEARRPVPKLPAHRLQQAPPTASGRLVVKFVDTARARLDANARLTSTAASLDDVQTILDQFGAQVAPAFEQNEQVLAQLQEKAAQRSGIAQPDLAGMMYITGMPGSLPAIAQALNDLNIVEFVEFEDTYVVGGGGGDTGACCVIAPGSCVDDITAEDCTVLGGIFAGVGSTCGDAGPCGVCCVDGVCQEPGPFDPPFTTAACMAAGGEIAGGQYSCALVSCGGACCLGNGDCVDTSTQANIEELCEPAGGVWYDGESCGSSPQCGGCCIGGDCDEEIFPAPIPASVCFAEGGQFANGQPCGGPDPCEDDDCGGGLTGPCGVVHAGVFCNNEDCCETVCEIDPFCCDNDGSIVIPGRGPASWDPWCVQHANELCGLTPPCVGASGPCTEVHTEVGCSVEFCCNIVCEQDPFCCQFEWDSGCASAASLLCLGSVGRCEVTFTDDTATCIDAVTETPCMQLMEAEEVAAATWTANSTCADNAFTPNFTPAQGYLTPAPYDAVGALMMAPSIPTIGGVPLDGYNGAGYDLQGLWEVAETLGALNGSPNLTRGRTIKVGVVEHTARCDWTDPADPTKNHEDLVGKIQPEQGQTQIIIEGDSALGANHGTACLGIIGAKDEDNMGNPAPLGLSPTESLMEETGCVGIAPEAELYFFPIVSVEQPGGRLLSAIANALTIFDPGDVLSFSIGPGGGGTLASSGANWIMLRFAADLGVTCCLAAGNDCFNLDNNPQANGDSDCIIVGACFPGAGGFNTYCRLGFSNHCQACTPESAVHVAAWGTAVTTLAYGALFAPAPEVNRYYTNGFNGTSAACPQVAAVVACLQGYSKMLHGIPLMPAQIRDIVATGVPQCGGTALGNDTNPCIGDWDPTQPENVITSYTNPREAAITLTQTSYFDDGDSFKGNVIIARGTHIYGNANSMAAPDNNYLVVESLFTDAGQGPTELVQLSSPGDSPFNSGVSPEETAAILDFTYLINGYTTDIVLVGSTNLNPTEFASTFLETQYPLPSDARFVFCYVFDWTSNRWWFIDLQNEAELPLGLAPNPGGLMQSDLGPVNRFVNPETKRMMVRYWSFGFNSAGFGLGDPSSQFIERHDWMDVGTASDFGVDPNDP